MSVPGEFTSGDVLAASEMNALPGGILGYAEITSNQASITTEVDVTGLSVLVDLPAGRRVRVTCEVRALASNDNNLLIVHIKEGATYLQRADGWNVIGASSRLTIVRSVVLTPSSGSHTYKLAAERSGTGSMTVLGAAASPSFILVEDIGSA